MTGILILVTLVMSLDLARPRERATAATSPGDMPTPAELADLRSGSNGRRPTPTRSRRR